MNYLAHIFLSGEDKEIAVGNFIGDGVKGMIKDRYPGPIGVGLRLHRFIDDMADNHAINVKGRQGFYHDFGKYAGVVQDMVHDHYLSKHWTEVTGYVLKDYLLEFYKVADRMEDVFPAGQRRFYHAMKEGEWLINYGDIDGMERAFKGLSSRIKADNNINRAADFIVAHNEELSETFFEFFPVLQAEVKTELERLLKSSR